MKIKRLRLTLHSHLWKAECTEENIRPPVLCHTTMRSLFNVPNAHGSVIYATVTTKRPTDPLLQEAYLEFRRDEDRFLDIKYPWKGAFWSFMPTLVELDRFLTHQNIKTNKRYFVYFEED